MMRFIETFQTYDFIDTTASLFFAFVLGAIIGIERQYRQRTAGLRTNVLVAVGAAAFVDLATRIHGAEGAARVISYVVSGIGFLGAGVIMKEGLNIRGLNTAATLWCSAAVGACAGADMAAQAALVTLFVMAGNTLLRPVVNAINRIPLDEEASEATYEVSVVSGRENADRAKDELVAHLEAASYPVGDLEVIHRPDATEEIVAKLVSTSVKTGELDAVVARLLRVPGISHATWNSSTGD